MNLFANVKGTKRRKKETNYQCHGKRRQVKLVLNIHV